MYRSLVVPLDGWAVVAHGDYATCCATALPKSDVVNEAHVTL